MAILFFRQSPGPCKQEIKTRTLHCCWAQNIEESGLTKVYSWNEVAEMGRKSPAPAIPPKPEDLCTIMYTSGTTGNPKVRHS